jgi:hypothetical protein
MNNLELFLDAIDQDAEVLELRAEVITLKQMLSVTLELLAAQTIRADAATQRLRQVMGFEKWNVKAHD